MRHEKKLNELISFAESRKLDHLRNELQLLQGQINISIVNAKIEAIEQYKKA
tara:strand:+ start:624 stop:779 length:156 start_codon:yes stop_codon:yes gene_type:complete